MTYTSHVLEQVKTLWGMLPKKNPRTLPMMLFLLQFCGKDVKNTTQEFELEIQEYTSHVYRKSYLSNYYHESNNDYNINYNIGKIYFINYM
jgi:hypothetical protein